MSVDLNKFVRSTDGVTKRLGIPLPAMAEDIPELQARVNKGVSRGNGVNMHYSGHDNYGLAFRFFIHNEKNEAASKLAKCELFDQVFCREVFVDKKTKVVQRVTQKIKDTWPDEWAAFEERKEAPGTPLDRWNHMPSNEILTLIKDGIYTVEQFAHQPSDKIKKYPPKFREHFEAAQQFVAAKSGLPAAKEMADKFIALERDYLQLQEQVAFLTAQSKQKGGVKKPGAKKSKAPGSSLILPAEAGIGA